jgi:hypothetical protein
MQEFPKWKYSRERSVIVHSAEEEQALGDGFHDRQDFVEAEPAKLPSAEDLDAVEEEKAVKEVTKKRGKKIDFPKL